METFPSLKPPDDPPREQVLTLAAAAAQLRVTRGTLRRWLRNGCPTVARGGRGRGHRTLIDVQHVQAWRALDGRAALVLSLAEQLPHVLAEAALQAFQQIEGSDKRRAAGLVAATWYMLASAALDCLREHAPAVREINALPAQIELLQKIARR